MATPRRAPLDCNHDVTKSEGGPCKMRSAPSHFPALSKYGKHQPKSAKFISQCAKLTPEFLKFIP